MHVENKKNFISFLQGGSRNQENEVERRDRQSHKPQATGATSRIRHDTTVGGVLPSPTAGELQGPPTPPAGPALPLPGHHTLSSHDLETTRAVLLKTSWVPRSRPIINRAGCLD